MSVAFQSRSDAPLSDLNMTPLIDVLLVLLIMFIVTIPIATHVLQVDIQPGDGGLVVERDKNKIVVTQEDRILWNGNAVSEAQLLNALIRAEAMRVEPQILLEPEALASYNTSTRVLRLVEVAGVSNFAFAGNEKYRQFAAE